jgi:hypothetical protein
MRRECGCGFLHVQIPSALIALLVTLGSVRGAFIDWSTISAGSIGPVGVTLTGLTDGPELSLSPSDLTDTAFIAFPGAGDQECLNLLCSDGWTATFDQPLTNFKLYAVLWRGADGGVNPVQYTFNRSFSILSGFTGASEAGNTLSLPDGDFYDGILQFTGTFSSLTVTSNATLENAQAMTFNADPVPEPTMMIIATMIITVAIRARRDYRAPRMTSTVS